MALRVNSLSFTELTCEAPVGGVDTEIAAALVRAGGKLCILG